MKSYRIEAKDTNGRVVKRGTAWAINNELVVTAFHVVADDTQAWLHEIIDCSYWLIDGTSMPVALDAVTGDSVADVALFRLASPTADRPRLSLQILPLGAWGGKVGSAWSAPSYPALAGKDRVTLTGKIKSVELEAGGDVFELHVAEGGGESWVGASGSPLYVDGRVVAMIVTELQGAATQHAISVQPILSLLRLAESMSLQEKFRTLVAANAGIGVSAGKPATIDQAISYGVPGMLLLLAQLPDTPEKNSYALELVTSTFSPDLIDWPRKPRVPDRRWERHPNYQIPPLLKNAWEHFIGAGSWHADLRLMLEQLMNALQTIHLSGDLARRLQKFDVNAQFGQIYADLSDLVDDVEDEIGDDHPQHDESVRDEIARIRQHIQPETPRSICFFLMGSSGSGKTHFLEWLLRRSEKDELILSVAWPKEMQITEATLEANITEALFYATGRRFESLAQFQEALDRFDSAQDRYCGEHAHRSAQCHPKLVIAFDGLQSALSDLHSAGIVCNALQALIESATIHQSIRWLFTLQDTFFDRLSMPVSSPSFWEEYGWVNDDAEAFANVAKAGWIDLDRICLHDGVGQTILAREIGARLDSVEPGVDLRKARLQRYMAMPWFSWILVSMGQEWCAGAMQSGDLNHIRIVEQLHQKKVMPLKESEAARRELGHYLRAVAAAMLPGDGCRLDDQAFCDDVAARCAEARMLFADQQFRSAVSRLIESSLLLTESIAFQTELAVEFVMLWGYEGAQYLQQILKGMSRLDVATRLRVDLASTTQDRLMLKESVLEFLLMLADQAGESTMIDSILALNVNELGDSVAAILFAAPKLGSSTQRRLADFDAGHTVADGASTIGRRLLLAKMMFAERADAAAFSPAGRLDFVRMQYQSIWMSGFSSYYRTVANGILDEVTDIATLRACMLSLNGCEQARLAEPLAKRTVELLFQLAKQESDELDEFHAVIETLVTYATDSLDHTKADYSRRQARKSEVMAEGEFRGEPGSSWSREFFREWVLHFACAELVELFGPAAVFRAFSACGWFQIGGKGYLHIEMEREATIAMGHYFHGKQHLQRTWQQGAGGEFIELVAGLARSDKHDERRLAFNMMVHTRPTGGRYRQSISSEFIPLLERLAKDPQLAGMNRFRGLYRGTVGHELAMPGKSVRPRKRW